MFLAAHLPYADEELVAYRDSNLDEKIKDYSKENPKNIHLQKLLI